MDGDQSEVLTALNLWKGLKHKGGLGLNTFHPGASRIQKDQKRPETSANPDVFHRSYEGIIHKSCCPLTVKLHFYSCIKWPLWLPVGLWL